MRAHKLRTVGYGAAATLALTAAMLTPAYAADVPRLITTVAGTGESGSSGNGGPATSAQVGYPEATALDAAGNLYIASRSQVRKVDTQGIITSVAGDGSNTCTAGEGLPATSTGVCASGLDVDAAGNLYIADYHYTQRVYRVGADGILTRVAGNGEWGFSGDGGPATSARVNAVDVAVDDAGNLYLTDFLNNRVRRVDTSGIITTVAGTGEWGSAGDAGPATSALLAGPHGVATDQAGNIYVSDTGNNRIRRIDPNGTISMFVGAYSSAARLDYPKGLDLDDAGNLYIADFGNNRVVRADPSGNATVLAGDTEGFSGDGGPATEAQLNNPYDVAVVSPDLMYVADFGNHRIRRLAVVAAPLANDDPLVTDVDSSATGNVLANDTGTQLAVSGNTTPLHGSAQITADGSLTYTPEAGYVGTDSFSYTVTDPVRQTSTARVIVTVRPAPPTAVNDSFRGCVLPLHALTVPAPGVLANDSPGGLTVTAYTQPARGTATVNPDGSFTFRNGRLVSLTAQTFSYTATDRFGRTATATVTIKPSLDLVCG